MENLSMRLFDLCRNYPLYIIMTGRLRVVTLEDKKTIHNAFPDRFRLGGLLVKIRDVWLPVENANSAQQMF